MARFVSLLGVSALLCARVVVAGEVHVGVLGMDGKSLPNAHVQAWTAAGPDGDPVAVDGAAIFPVTEVGVLRLRISAVDHAAADLVLPLDDPSDDVHVVARLSRWPHSKEGPFRVVGGWNDFDLRSAELMTEEADGTWSFARSGVGDTVAYGIVGVLPGNLLSPGTGAVGVRPRPNGDYAALGVGPDLSVRLDPSDFSEGVAEPAVVWEFGQTDDRYRRIMDVLEGLQAIRDNRPDAADAIRSICDPILANETDPLVRGLAAVGYSRLTQYPGALDSSALRMILDEAPPNSLAWSFGPSMPAAVCGAMYLGGVSVASLPDSGSVAQFERMMRTFAEESPAQLVRANALLQCLAVRVQIQDREEAIRLHREIAAKYGDLPGVQGPLVQLNPDRPVVVGKAVPPFEVERLDGLGTIGSKSLLGQTYLLDFWATWCRPCVAEMPVLHQAFEEYGGDGFTIVSVSLDRQKSAMERFHRGRWKMPWIHHYAGSGGDSAILRDFEVVSIPLAVLVGPEGTILETGPALRGGNLKKTLARHLQQEEK